MLLRVEFFLKSCSFCLFLRAACQHIITYQLQVTQRRRTFNLNKQYFVLLWLEIWIDY